ncbi:MAG: methyltransferase [Dermabacter sp.]|nr:methyltransferase [Dermabacter sp.]
MTASTSSAHPDAHELGASCHHFRAGKCGSCTLMGIPHATQVRDAERDLRDLLAPFGDIAWLPPILSEPWGFRTKAKMTVAGTASAPVLTLPQGSDAPAPDLADCPLYPPLVTEVLESARAVLRRAQVPPYSPATRRGEAKHVLVTASETEALVRFVLRTDGALGRVREHLGLLDPRVVAVSANIHPEHSAVIEGPTEIPLAGAGMLRLPVGPLSLGVLPQSFTQTNTAVAAALYAQVAEWVLASGARRVWDLYCGVGGFALSIAQRADAGADGGGEVHVTGVEITPAAISSAQATAREAGLEDATTFLCANATAWASAQSVHDRPDAAVINPPRRGIGPTLAEWLNTSGIPTLVYSTCNPRTLAADLAWMPQYTPRSARLVDMFPHTGHNEAVVLLGRKEPS